MKTPGMTFRKKILLGYGVAFLLMGIVIVWAISTLLGLGKASTAILQENYRSILAAESMLNAIERQDSAILLGFVGRGAKADQLFRTNETEFLQWLSRARDNITLNDETAIIQTVDSAYTAYLAQVSRLQVLQTEDTETAKTLYAETIYPGFTRIQHALNRLRGINQDAMYQASDHARTVARQAIWSTAAVGVAGIILGILFSIVISGQITQPVQRLMEAARGLASGDYRVRVRSESRDELGRLAEEFNRMADELERFHHLNIDQILTEKQKSEAILASIEDGILVLDQQEQVMNMNRPAERLFDVTFREDQPPVPMTSILDDTELLEQIRTVLHSGQGIQTHNEQRIISLPHQGKTRYFSYTVTPIHGKERHLLGVVVHLSDVTRLKELDQLKSEFVMAASHELRTPLTSIGMSIGLLKEHVSDRLDGKDRELLDAAQTEVRQLKALVNDLLDLSRIETGQITMQYQSTPVAIFAERVRSVFASQLAEKTVTLEVSIPEELPPVRADANKITWVITNLVSNALRYVDPGGHIWFEAIRNGSFVQVAVRDDGPGIPLEDQSRIFQRFVQLDRSGESEGSGLGLAICKEIVRAHGGTIWVESTKGEGSTFFFTLPVTRNAREENQGE